MAFGVDTIDGRGQQYRRLQRRTVVADSPDGPSARHDLPSKVRATGLSVVVIVFLVSLFIPWIISIGSFRMSPNRLVLTAALVPCLFLWVTGRAGLPRLTDFALILYSVWISLSLIVLHGVGVAAQPAGIVVIETLGAYFVARCFIRTADDFHRMVRILFIMVVCMLPLAFFEALTTINISRILFGTVLPTFPDVNYEPRWGMRRVQSVFEHPILFGVCASSIFGMTYLVLGYRQSLFRKVFRTGLVGMATFLSLSAGPITAMAAQVVLMGWSWVFTNTRYRWKLFLAGFAASWIFISIISSQSVPAFYITHFTFDQQNAYFRILIWEFGMNSISHYPVFGTGLNEWVRPSWMPPSIDMFWLIHAIWYGVPAAFFMALAFLSAYYSIALKANLTDREATYRFAYIVAMTGYFVVGWTVHFWNASYVLFAFLLGSGFWILDTETTARKIGRTQS